MRTRVVPVLLMSCGPSGGNDAAEILVAHGGDDEQSASGRHADGVYPLLTIGETVVDILDPDRIEQRADRVEKIDPSSQGIGAVARVATRVRTADDGALSTFSLNSDRRIWRRQSIGQKLYRSMPHTRKVATRYSAARPRTQAPHGGDGGLTPAPAITLQPVAPTNPHNTTLPARLKWTRPESPFSNSLDPLLTFRIRHIIRAMTGHSYIRVKWNHSSPDEPVKLWSELDAERFEVRKVEFGRMAASGYAESSREVGVTSLGLLPVPLSLFGFHRADCLPGTPGYDNRDKFSTADDKQCQSYGLY